MRGLELSKQCYIESFDKLFENHIHIKHRVSCGLVGSGSQCLGFDDEISKDHDFEKGFAIWLQNEDYKLYADELIKQYQRLYPKHKNNNIYGISSVDKYISGTITKLPLSSLDWFHIPEQALLNATNGAVFYDPIGDISNIRAYIQACPSDVFVKRASAHLALASQAGEYNFERLIERMDTASAMLAISEFAKHTIYAVHAIYNKFTPFYKWMFNSLRLLNVDIYNILNSLMLSPKSYSHLDNNIAYIRQIASLVASLCKQDTNNMGELAHTLHSQIHDPQIKAMHIMDYGA